MFARASMFASDGGGCLSFGSSQEREASLLGLGVVKGNNLGYRMIPCWTRDDYVHTPEIPAKFTLVECIWPDV